MSRTVDELWLQSLQKLTAHVAHDLKGALNGVSVNLEVVRTRAERETSTGADVHRFAVTAADQLAVVIRGTGAMLSLGRASRSAAEVGTVVKQVATLISELTSSQHGKLEVVIEGGLSAESAAPLNAVRLAVTECLLATATGTGDVSVRVAGLPAPVVTITPAGDPSLDPAVMSALSAAGIRFGTVGHGISIAFPGPADPPTEDE